MAFVMDDETARVGKYGDSSIVGSGKNTEANSPLDYDSSVIISSFP